MNVWARLLLSSALVLSWGCAATVGLPSPEIFSVLRSTMLHAQVNGQSIGACVRIQPSQCVTAYHVVQYLQDLGASLDVVAQSESQDLALLNVPEGPWASVGPVPPVGSMVGLVIYSMGIGPLAGLGIVALQRESGDLILLGWGGFPGISGGGVFDSQRRLVAIVVGMVSMPSPEGGRVSETILSARPVTAWLQQQRGH